LFHDIGFIGVSGGHQQHHLFRDDFLKVFDVLPKVALERAQACHIRVDRRAVTQYLLKALGVGLQAAMRLLLAVRGLIRRMYLRQ